nr:reverse transcriptase domain-containing protein [Tanacetum cinerariifolium]
MTTHNAGRRTAATRGKSIGGQTGRGGGRTREKTNKVVGRTSDQGSRRGGRRNIANGGADEVGDYVSNQGNVNANNSRNGCSYKDFVACKPKEFDGKDGAVAYIYWVEKMKAVHDINACRDNQKIKYSAGSLTGRALTWWNSEIRGMVAATQPPTIQSVILKVMVLTDETVRNGSLKVLS